VACNLSLQNELITSKPIGEWKNMPLPDFNKQPTVFLLLS
jgi:16S rRNA (cytidine1402-2'-O)-methyltransferase